MKVGDKVRLLRGSEEGFISAFLKNNLIEIEIEDGFKIPVMRNEVVVIAADENKYFDRGYIEPKESAPVKKTSTASEGMYLAFVEINDQQLSLYLINNTSYSIPFAMSEETTHALNGVAAGMLTPGASQKINEKLVSQFDQWPTVVVQLLFHQNSASTLKMPLSKKFKFKAASFFRSKRVAPVLEKPAFLFKIDEESQLPDLEFLKENLFKGQNDDTRQPRVTVPKPSSVVDLHIEKIATAHEGLTNAQMLEMQLQHFEQALDGAIASGMDEITFIHGSGHGVLKNAIQKKLSKHSQVQFFKDAMKEKFGYGATLVKLK